MAWNPPRERSSTATHVLVLALGCAVVHGTVNRGGFQTGDAATLLVLLAAAALARTGVHPRVPHPAAPSSASRQGELRVSPAAHAAHPAHAVTAVTAVTAAILALLGFAAWALVRGDGARGVPAAALAVGLAAAAWAATGLDAASRRVLHAVVIACGLVVAATGWIGVALHLEPLALVSSGLWRASSTLTYANAAAAFLVAVLLLAVAVVPATGADRGRRPAPVTVFVLLLGLAATMSRAGLLSLAVGVLVLLASAHYRDRLRALWPVLPAVAVAFAGLLPALPEMAGPARLLPASAGLAAGLAILFLDRRTVVLAAGAVAVAVVIAVPSATFADLASTRLSATSAERGDLTRVTAAQFLDSPLTGVGPGRLDLVYVDHRGVLVRAEYTHDEYLQVAAETGVVGLGLAGTALGALVLAAARRWRDVTGAPALAIVAAFALHSAADFLWHIPVLPLLVLLCTVPLLTRPLEES